jgi:formamidopyrimidine-DNA glycosylase
MAGQACSKCGTLLERTDMARYLWCPKCQKYEPMK